MEARERVMNTKGEIVTKGNQTVIQNILILSLTDFHFI